MLGYKISGTVAKGFERVYQQFENNFIDGLEDYCQLCVYVGEERVVDLWGGIDESTQYNADTFTNIFSSTKCIEAICIAKLVDKKLLNYSDRVIEHWPEYGNGDKEKESMTIAQILRHQGGMANFTKTLRLADIQTENIKKNAIGRVIEQEPLRFPPPSDSTKSEYHALTRGWILNELFRRVDPDHRTMGECLQEDICAPLNVEAYIGLPFEQLSNSFSLSAKSLIKVVRSSMVPKSLGRKTEPNIMDLMKLMKMFGTANKKVPALEHMNGFAIANIIKQIENSSVRSGESPSVNGQCSARGIARIASVMANKGEIDGIEIISEDTWNSVHSGYEEGTIMYPFLMPLHFSQGGVNHFRASDNSPSYIKASSENRKGYFGWIGFGGSVFQWYPKYKIGFGYVPTLLAWEDMGNSRGALLQKIVLDCVKRRQEFDNI